MARAHNNNIKKPNQEIEYTYAQVQELKKCADDPVHFISRYVMIQHPLRGSIPFELYDYQIKMIESYKANRFNIVLSSRQTGKCSLYSTQLNVIERPKGLRKVLLMLINREAYDEVFKVV